jgi:2-keto-4-pentenoate hydratase/2-oxohepta-3-ene-1,7-dioic acid hydratase (catechol pathway)
MTNDLHHEVELVVAIAKPLQKANREDLKDSIFGYACGLDMTRRDLQSIAKKQGKPWDMSKDFDGSAIIGEITEVEKVPQIRQANLKLFLNNILQQHGRIADMIYSVDEILLDLSKYTQLIPGDVVMTGTPAGVSAVKPGDLLVAQIDGLTELKVKITE